MILHKELMRTDEWKKKQKHKKKIQKIICDI